MKKKKRKSWRKRKKCTILCVMQNPFHEAFSSVSVSDSFIPQGAVVGLTESGVGQIKKIQAQENNPNLMLRIAIAGGGCSGFQYRFTLDDRQNADDNIFQHNGAAVICDNISLQYLNGAVIEYKETLSGSAFHIQNPNAQSSCGCGVSFAPTK